MWVPAKPNAITHTQNQNDQDAQRDHGGGAKAEVFYNTEWPGICGRASRLMEQSRNSKTAVMTQEM